MTASLREMVGRRDLLFNLIRADLASRYRTTALGVLWFVLTPLLWALVLAVVFEHVVRLGIPDYPVFVLSALLAWAYFQTAVGAATSSVSRSTNLVKRVRIPRAYLPLAAVGATLVHFLASLLVLAAALILSGIGFSGALLLLPAIILVETACICGVGLIGASLNVFYRDVELILTAALRAMFYLTPSFYPLAYVPEEWRTIYLLNPMAGIIHTYREVLLYGAVPEGRVLIMAVLGSAAILVVGVVLFLRTEPAFEDHL